MQNKISDLESIIYSGYPRLYAIIYNPYICEGQREVLHGLIAVMGRLGGFRNKLYIAVQTIADEIGRDHTFVRKHIKTLAEQKYITREFRFDPDNPKLHLPSDYQITDRIFSEWVTLYQSGVKLVVPKKRIRKAKKVIKDTPPSTPLTGTPLYATNVPPPSTLVTTQMYLTKYNSTNTKFTSEPPAQTGPECSEGLKVGKREGEDRKVSFSIDEFESRPKSISPAQKGFATRLVGDVLHAFAKGDFNRHTGKEWICFKTRSRIAAELAEHAGFDIDLIKEWKDSLADYEGDFRIYLEKNNWFRFFDDWKADPQGFLDSVIEREEAPETLKAISLPPEQPKASEAISEAPRDNSEESLQLIESIPAEDDVKRKLKVCVERGMALSSVRQVANAFKNGSGHLSSKTWFKYFNVDSLQTAG